MAGKTETRKIKISVISLIVSNEIQIAIPFVEATNNLVKCVRELIKHPLGSELYELANRTSSNLEKINLCGKIQQGPELRQLLTSLVNSARELHDQACALLKEMRKLCS
uniref:Diacylglycerol kinase eta-like protein n=1 Tax=Triatoma infestans TaxID=30076 RepID=A0A161M452_TRIIF